MKEKLNVLLITVDQMRGDCIEKFGKREINTPYLNSLANEGVMFDRAYSATPSCIPARAAILTGLSQRNHGRVGYEDFIDWDYKDTMPEIFTKNGYQTRCVGKMHVWPPRKNLGFEEVELCDGYLPHRNVKTQQQHSWWRVDDYINFLKEKEGIDADFAENGVDCNSYVVRPWNYNESSHPTNWATSQAIKFFKRRDTSRPFFMHLSYYAPHPPYTPPQCYLDMYKDLQVPPVEKQNWEVTGDENPTFNSFHGKLKERQRRDLTAGYYASITHIDHQIGRMIRMLRDEGVINNTVILFTSDHGEMLSDHQMFRKYWAYEGSSHIPFIVADFGNNLGLDKGARSDEIVELRDVFATLAGVCGINQHTDGENVVDKIKAGESVREYLHGEHTAFYDGDMSIQYIVDKEYKYIWNTKFGEEQLFDMKTDRKELCNLAGDTSHNEILEKYRKILATELDGRPEGYSNGKNLIVGKRAVTML